MDNTVKPHIKTPLLQTPEENEEATVHLAFDQTLEL